MNVLLTESITRIASVLPINILKSHSKQQCIFPFYHAVSDNDVLHIKHLYKVHSKKKFEQDLDFFLKHYNRSTTNQLISDKQNTQQSKGDNFYLTFDDGLREFYDIIAPILVRKGIEATCFLNTAFIDNHDLFYRYKASLLIERLETCNFSKPVISEINSLFYNHNLIYKSPKDFLKISWNTKEILDRCAQILEFDFDDYLRNNKPYMSLTQILELKDMGFNFGAHSVNHPNYYEIDLDTQLKETLESMHYIKEIVNSEYSFFSFPFTDYKVQKPFFDKIKKDVQLTFGTANLKLDEIDFNIQRIPMETNSYYSAETILKKQYLIFILKRILNKHIIYR